MKKKIIAIFGIAFFVFAETLFEVKDSSNHTVLDVSTDGLRVLNEGDTMMVISPSGVNFNIRENKGLSRTFSVTTASSKGKGLINALEVGTEYTTMSSYVGKYTDFSPKNIFLGLNSGLLTTPNSPYTLDGTGNVFLGNESGKNNTSGKNNVMIGEKSGLNNTLGLCNIFIGKEAGTENTQGSYNVFIGFKSGYKTTRNENVFIGNYSGMNNTDGDGNVFLGSNTGTKNTTGYQNLLVGISAGNNNTIGANNIFLGAGTGSANISGNSNTYIGNASGQNSTGSGNLFLGYASGSNETASNKLYVANSNTSTPLIKGTFPNTDLTFKATTITADGNFNVTGSSSINGNLSISGTTTSTGLITAQNNIFLNGTYFKIATDPGTGATPTNYVYQGLTGSTTKSTAFAINDALWVAKNSFLDGTLSVGSTLGVTGATTLSNSLTVAGNVGIGTTSPSEKIHIKNGNLRIESTGSPYIDFFETGYSDRFGIYSDFSGYSNENRLMFTSNSTGSVPQESDAKMTMLQNGNIGIGISDPLYQLQLSLNSAAKPTSSSWTVPSDLRLKDLKGGYSKGLDEIVKLVPIVYRYKDDNAMGIKGTGNDAFGFIAQDVQEIFPEAVSVNDKGYLALDLHPVFVAQVNAVKTLNSKIDKLEIENKNLKKEIEEIKQLLLKK